MREGHIVKSGSALLVGLVHVWAAVGLCACSDTGGDDAGAGEGEHVRAVMCSDGASTELTLEETSETGTSAADLLATAEGEFEGTVQWADGSASGLSIQIAYAGGLATYVELEPTLPVYTCREGEVRVEVRLTVNSEDGRLAESMDVQLESSASGDVHIHEDVVSVSGSLDLAAFVHAPELYDRVDYVWSFYVSSAGRSVSGTLYGLAEGHDGDSNGPQLSTFLDTIAVGDFDAQPVGPSS